jgi:hypothetical protein
MAKKTKALKLVFSVGESKTMTVSLLNPKDGLTKAEAEAVGKSIVDKQAILSGGAPVTALKDCYVQNNEREELA